jgi:hypothetical protein
VIALAGRGFAPSTARVDAKGVTVRPNALPVLDWTSVSKSFVESRFRGVEVEPFF